MDLEKLKQLCEKAPPFYMGCGNFFEDEWTPFFAGIPNSGQRISVAFGEDECQNVVNFCNEARTAVPELIAIIERQRISLQALQRLLEINAEGEKDE
jgi:hypothetical protein